MFFTNLGMLGMNVGLDVRVIDQIGLANPLAAHTARLEDGRIGHDKNLFPDWAVAEGPFLKEHPYIPAYLDEDWVAQAEVGAQVPGDRGHAQRRCAARWVRGGSCRTCCTRGSSPSTGSTACPLYELARCGLQAPPPKGAPYTGLPATGP